MRRCDDTATANGGGPAGGKAETLCVPFLGAESAEGGAWLLRTGSGSPPARTSGRALSSTDENTGSTRPSTPCSSMVCCGFGRSAGATAMRMAVAAPDTARGREERFKRPFDLAVLAFGTIVLLPVWPVLIGAIALAVRLSGPGPVVYRQSRLGRDGRAFEILKFRTMAADAEQRTGPVWAASNDARATPVGRVLRRFHLDELPQAVNVLRGEMSLVGPRPERPALAARIERTVPAFSRRLRVRPGIAGLAQARGHGLRAGDKLRYDLCYIAAMGPWLDLKLCLLCVCRALWPGQGPAPRRAMQGGIRPARRRPRAGGGSLGAESFGTNV